MNNQTCSTCRHIQPAGKQSFCRRFPPQTHFIIVPRPRSMLTPNDMVPSEEQRSAFPAVMPDWACGEWAPKIETMS